jgi:UDP-N-acetylglucosamine acyltransferase
MTNRIHPTALVDPGAELAADVSVGPFAIIEDEVKIGAGARIAARAHICRGTELGPGCEVHMGVTLGHLPQDLSFDPDLATRLVIGEGCVFREGATAHRATQIDRPTTIGDRAYVMVNAHVAHDAQVGDDVILCNNALLAGHAVLGDRVFVSGNAAIHQFCRVGALTMISGVSGTSLDIPPYCIVSDRSIIRGLNVVGMKRAGISGEERGVVKALYRSIARAEGDRDALESALASAPDLESVHCIRAFYAEDSRKGLAWPRVLAGR